TDWPNWLNRAGLGGEHIRFKHVFDHLFVTLHCVRDGIGMIVAPRNIFGHAAAKTIFRPILPRIGFKGESYFVYYRATGRTGAIGKVAGLLRAYSGSMR